MQCGHSGRDFKKAFDVLTLLHTIGKTAIIMIVNGENSRESYSNFLMMICSALRFKLFLFEHFSIIFILCQDEWWWIWSLKVEDGLTLVESTPNLKIWILSINNDLGGKMDWTCIPYLCDFIGATLKYPANRTGSKYFFNEVI